MRLVRSLLLLPLLALWGLAACKSPITLDQPLNYPCAPDGGAGADSCPTGYRCGLEGYCHSVDEARDYLCHSDTDCEQGWRCGLNGRCHSRDAGADYLCRTDGDCEKGWRCGPEARCLDVREEALLPAPVTRTPSVTPQVPPLLAGPPRLVEGAQRVYVPWHCGQSEEVSLVAWVEGDTLGLHAVMPRGMFDVAPDTPTTECEGAQRSAPRRYVRSERFPLGGRRVEALAVVGTHVYALEANGTLCRYPLVPFGAITPECGPSGAPAGATQLRVSTDTSRWSWPNSERLVAFSRTELAVQESPDAGFGPARTVRTLDGGTPLLRDVLLLTSPGTSEQQVIAATSEGLYVSVLDGGTGWDGVAPADSWECHPTPDSALGQLRWVPDESATGGTLWMARAPFGGVEGEPRGRVGALRAVPRKDDPFCPPVPTVSGNVLVVPSTGNDCWLCAGALTGFGLQRQEDGGTLLEARCEAADGGQTVVLTAANGDTCGRMVSTDEVGSLIPRVSYLERPAVLSRAHPRELTVANALGQVWVGGLSAPSKQGLVPDRVPELLGGDERTLVAWQPPLAWGGWEVVESSTGVVQPDAGTLLLDTALDFLNPAAAVPDRLGWFLIRPQESASLNAEYYWLEVHPLRRTLRGLSRFTTVDRFTPPFTAVTSAAAGDRVLLLTASFDTLLSADVTDYVRNLELGAVGSFEDLERLPVTDIRLVPLPRGAITSLAPLPPGEAYAQGYLLAGARVFRYRAANPVVWRADEFVFLSGIPLEVWTDEGRGRVGFRDGAVRSLPGRVDLAPPLPAGAGEVVDYAQVCGHVFALSSGGVWRLVADGTQPLGAWREVPLGEEVRRGTRADGFARGRLHPGQRELFLFDPAGRPFRLTDLECR